jgi:hypothetical protein
MPPVHARTFLRRAGLWRPRRRWRARLPGAGVPVCTHPHPRASGGFLRAPAPGRRKGETAQPSRGPISLCNNVEATLSCTLSPQCRLLPCATPPTRWFPPVVGQSTLRHHPAPVSGAAPVAGAAPEPRVVSAPRVSCVVIGGGSGAAGSGITGTLVRPPPLPARERTMLQSRPGQTTLSEAAQPPGAAPDGSPAARAPRIR